MEKNVKLRPFLVAKIIFERTDEDNYLTIAQILDPAPAHAVQIVTAVNLFLNGDPHGM